MKVTKPQIIIAILLFLPLMGLAQQNDTLKEQELFGVHIDRQFDWKYKRMLEDVLRVYPLAIEARNVIDQYEKDLVDIEKKRKQKQYLKESEKELKLNFEYTLKDLYVSEGKLLMKLIHRETGLTVDDILRKYKGGFNASTTGAALKMFGHDTKIKYDPDNEDWICEVVIQDIISGKVQANLQPRTLNKAEYKAEMKVYRQDIKDTRQKRKERKKKYRKQKKEAK